MNKELSAKQMQIYQTLKALYCFRQDCLYCLLFDFVTYQTEEDFITDWELNETDNNLLELLQATGGLQAYRKATNQLQGAMPLPYKVLCSLADAEAYGTTPIYATAQQLGMSRSSYYRHLNNGLAYIAQQLAE